MHTHPAFTMLRTLSADVPYRCPLYSPKIINIKHKYLLKIMSQSFILMVLGVFMYLIQAHWISTYIRAFVEMVFLLVFIEAMAVVPLPIQLSNTVSPSLVYVLMRYSNKATGF